MNIIAEIGTSHEGSIEKAKLLVDAAADSGANTIKFQWVYADEILHPNTGFVELPTGSIPLYERFRQLECDKSFYIQIQDYVHSKGCKFCCSPFGLRSMQELLSIKPDIVKIASPELNHYKMLQLLAEYRAGQPDGEKVPVVISSGVSKLADIEKAIEILGREGVSLLHCITSYPAPEEEYNLKVISNLIGIFGVEAGVSDHSLDPILVPCLSVLCGGTIIEKHITLSRQTKGLDDPVALEPEQFALMSHTVGQTQASLRHYGPEVGFERAVDQLSQQFGKEKVLACLGSGVKELAHAELANYERTNRSLHYMRDLKAGQKITKEDIGILRTEKLLTPGCCPDFYDLLLGKKLVKDVQNGAGVQLSDFMAV
ncbi:MAG: N-acetylneuraminate synthase family protein [Treponema sp.]|nr:N-acetylneuraminate synthase family protein [Treponema sp.]